ncbi:MAG TPA: hypothetical protein VFQ00_00535 [Terriglobales bacterium]|nr:hypothetical protein [Terriglobales bacterium]
MQDSKLKLTVNVRGVMVHCPPNEFVPRLETHLRAEHASSARFSPFVRGMLWGVVVSMIVWILAAIIAMKFWL